jgi:hypothetical protein
MFNDAVDRATTMSGLPSPLTSAAATCTPLVTGRRSEEPREPALLFWTATLETKATATSTSPSKLKSAGAFELGSDATMLPDSGEVKTPFPRPR